MTLEGLRGYGDFLNYFNIAALPGWPFMNFWVEYPPVLPFFSALMFRLASGQEHVYDYLLAFMLLAADSMSVWLVARLALRLYPPVEGQLRVVVYMATLLCVAYGWGYYEPLVVMLMLLGIGAVMEGRTARGAVAVGIGIATKFFPAAALLAGWKRLPTRRLVLLAGLSLLPLIISCAVLWQTSPAYTEASLRSQISKGSWQTVWALIDGNFGTGNFGAVQERVDPQQALQMRRNPPVISPLASLVVFGGLGLVAAYRVKPPRGSETLTVRQSLSLVGLAWGLFLLWSPGWSPQWILYIIPLILLALPLREGALLVVVMTLLTLLEWPVLLSRGFFWGLWLTIPLRTLLLAVMTASFYTEMLRPNRGLLEPA
jgi:hypothetical protein